MIKKQQRAMPVRQVKVQDPFWSQIQNMDMDTVIPYQEQILNDEIPGAAKSHAIENFRIAAGEAEGTFFGMVFQDSDLAKWLEAVAYTLANREDPALEARADGVIDLIGRAQDEDGYLNTYFTLKEPEHKWQNLQECHELYCSGHMIEAAVAYYEATGKDAFLKIMNKNADLICDRFGSDKIRGIPGHQEIELALLRLYRVTGNRKYVETARYFLDERGLEPNFFAEEKKKRGWEHFHMDPEDRDYAQNHAPVREQDRAVGHSVRAAYMYAAMADLASETHDETLFNACRKIWDNIVQKQMYITGGVGATVSGEAFSTDYDLPNDTVYAETCASIAMVFFARQMLEVDVNGEYADIIEKMIYNGALSGMQLDGKRFFYVNPLEVVPGISGKLYGHKHVLPQRPEWYTCACCPPNLARLITSLGLYAWGEGDNTVYVHSYLGGETSFTCAGGGTITCQSDYPWQGDISYQVIPAGDEADFVFALHIPGWCRNWTLRVNGEDMDLTSEKGYVYLSRNWQKGDQIALSLDIQPRRVYSNSQVRENNGSAALMRGPIVYCLEEADMGTQLSAVKLPREAVIRAEHENNPRLGNIIVLKTDGIRQQPGEDLYSEKPPQEESAEIKAIPYYSWGNRGLGEMRVWIREKEC